MVVVLKKKVQKRIAVTISLFLILVIGLIARIFWIQFIQGSKLSEIAQSQVHDSKALQSPRGTIYDRNGKELAVSILTKSLFIDPYEVKDPEFIANGLGPILGMNPTEILEKINYGGRFVWVKRMLEPEVVAKVIAFRKDNKLNCLGFEDESKRYYPNNTLAAQVLGFVGTDDIGLDGIELMADDVIRGSADNKKIATDAYGSPILNSIFSFTARKNHKDVYLTLDNNIQFIVEQAMDKAIMETKAHAMTVIVMNPQTGEVLAMANRPTYNPNEFYKFSQEQMKNRAVSSIYEPGSTFKAMVAAAGLQEELIHPNDILVDQGYIQVADRRIKNWSGDSYGSVSFTEVIKKSINTGFVQIGMRLGSEKLINYAKAFGFGKATGLGLPGEENGLLFEPKDMTTPDVATMSIGQSIAVTPMQLITAMSGIANKGQLLKPHIIKEIKNEDNSIFQEFAVQGVNQVITAEKAQELTMMLEKVVSDGGGKLAAVKGYRIAGKTGTAEKLNDNGIGYKAGHYIASFCGFAPVENPQVAVLVVLDDPDGKYYGGEIAAPIAGGIFEQVLRYLNIKPAYVVDIQPTNSGGNVAMPSPPVTINGPEGKVVVPNLQGKSIRMVSTELSNLGLVLIPNGNGVAQKQNIMPNSIVDKGTYIVVDFAAN